MVGDIFRSYYFGRRLWTLYWSGILAPIDHCAISKVKIFHKKSNE